EARVWDRPWFQPDAAAAQLLAPSANRNLTGDPRRSWLDDLIARGPFDAAAMLGCDEDDTLESAWMRAGASTRLDVSELSSRAIRRRGAPAPPGARHLPAA